MVDVVQATFASTYRTGDWPRRTVSHAARHLSESIAKRLEARGLDANGETATEILETAALWENEAKPMHEVVAEFRRLVDDEARFPVPDVEMLTKSAAAAVVDADEGREHEE